MTTLANGETINGTAGCGCRDDVEGDAEDRGGRVGGVLYRGLVSDRVNDLEKQMTDPALAAVPGYRGWVLANVLSFLEGGHYGADYTTGQSDVVRESKVHLRGAVFGLRTIGGLPGKTWRWYVPAAGSLSEGDLAVGFGLGDKTAQIWGPDAKPRAGEDVDTELAFEEGDAEFGRRVDVAGDSAEPPQFDGETATDSTGPWTGSPEQLAFRDRVLAAHIDRSGRGGRRAPKRDLRPEEIGCVPETLITRKGRTSCVETASDTAAAAGRLLAAANSDLAAAQQAGDEDALRTIKLTAVSGYRSSETQRSLWLGYFAGDDGYYNQTRTARAGLPDGPHSEQAVAYLLDPEHGFGLGGKIAAPGYSNHQGGIAVDLWQERTKGHAIANKSTKAARARWRDTWFYRWLKDHAVEHKFEQLATEEWHWEYQRPPTGTASTTVRRGLAAGLVAADTAVSDYLGGRLWTFRAATLGLPVAVFCPRAALGRADVDVLLYAHGLLDGCHRPRQLPAGLVTDPPFALGKVVDTSGRPIVLVVPLLDWANPGGRDAFGADHPRWHALAKVTNLDNLVGEVLAEIGRVQSSNAPALHELVVAGHSRAYDLLEPLAHQRHDPAITQGRLAALSQIWAFDTTYVGQVDRWLDWLAGTPRLRVALFYRPDSPTAAIGDTFYAQRGDRLAVTRVSENHCDVPVRRMPALLTPAGAAKPAEDVDAAESETDLSAILRLDGVETVDGEDVGLLAESDRPTRPGVRDGPDA